MSVSLRHERLFTSLSLRWLQYNTTLLFLIETCSMLHSSVPERVQNILDLDVCHDSFMERVRNVSDLDLCVMLHSLIPERVHNLYDLDLSVV